MYNIVVVHLLFAHMLFLYIYIYIIIKKIESFFYFPFFCCFYNLSRFAPQTNTLNSEMFHSGTSAYA